MKYYLYVNAPNDKAIVHREGCSFSGLHGGEHRYKQGYWREFATRADAFAAMERTGKTTQRGCMPCAP